MTREEAKAFAAIIAAYGDGKTVQFKGTLGWEDLQEAYFDQSHSLYRIKPTPKLRPFRRGEIKCGDVVKRKDTNEEAIVIYASANQVELGRIGVVFYAELFAEYTMADGSPCGREEEE